MSNKLSSPTHYIIRLQKIEEKIKNLAKNSSVLQAGRLSKKYRYLAKTYKKVYKRLKKVQKEVTLPSIKNIEKSLNIGNNTSSIKKKIVTKKASQQMRIKLKNIGSETRKRYRATVGRMGIKSNSFKGFPERTIVLNNVIDMETNEEVTDHLWFTAGKQIKELNLKAGDIISFNARVGIYKKGYKHKEKDYKLNRMTKIVVDKRIERELAEGELTSASEPSFEELREAQSRARLEKIKNSDEYNSVA